MRRWLLLGLSWLSAQALAVPWVDDRGRSVDVPAHPLRVVTLSPSLTETVCALRACDRLVGIDRHSNWPAQVQRLPRLGGLEDAQVERIVALKPDLVLAATSTRAVDRLEALGLPVLALEPRTLDDSRRVVLQLARVLGTPAAGPQLWQQVEARIAEAAGRVPTRLRGNRVYFEVASTPFAAGEASFIGELLARLGLRNIVPAAMGPFPQLSPEFIVRAQPDWVMATAQNLAEMPARPGWGTMRALQQGQVCGFGPAQNDMLMRPGPRLGEAAELIVACMGAARTIGAER